MIFTNNVRPYLLWPPVTLANSVGTRFCGLTFRLKGTGRATGEDLSLGKGKRGCLRYGDIIKGEIGRTTKKMGYKYNAYEELTSSSIFKSAVLAFQRLFYRSTSLGVNIRTYLKSY